MKVCVQMPACVNVLAQVRVCEKMHVAFHICVAQCVKGGSDQILPSSHGSSFSFGDLRFFLAALECLFHRTKDFVLNLYNCL